MKRLPLYRTIVFFFSLALGVAFTSCEEPADLDLPLGEPRMVISGWITNKEEPYTVSVTQTIGFNDQSTDPGVEGAEVYVTDRLSRRFDFNPTTQKGIYQSDPNTLTGIPGEAYILHVVLPDGKEFVSEREVLQPVPKLDTVFYGTSFDPTLPITDPNAKVFFAKGTIEDIPDIRNFYRWKMYVNDTLKNLPGEVVIFNDKFTDGRTFELKVTDILMKEGDELRVEQLSLTESAYDYYALLIALLDNAQVGPNTPPSAIRGNIRCVGEPDELVLGYFGASQIIEKTIRIGP